MDKIKSEGICVFCDKKYTKAGINRHLKKHIEVEAIQNKKGKSFFLTIKIDSSWGSSPHFLSLWINGDTEMEDLDLFLRAIWLECCGHASSFKDSGKTQKSSFDFNFLKVEKLLEQGKKEEYETLMEEMRGEIPMGKKAKEVFSKGLKLNYEYDYGSTTALEIITVEEFQNEAPQAIFLLSRNEPSKIICSSCNTKPANVICTVCSYEEEAMFCSTCAMNHVNECDDFEEYAAMPIVNSPRMGVCGYEGGTIDQKRDHVNFKVLR